MSEDQDRLYKRLRDLLNLSERGATRGEMEAATLAAARLIEKYNLDADKARNYTSPAEVQIAHERVFIHDYLPQAWQKIKGKHVRVNVRNRAPYYRWVQWPPKSYYEYGHQEWFTVLAEAIAYTCGCKAPIFSPSSVVFIGEPDKVKQAAFLLGNIFRRILIMAEDAVKTYAAEYKAENGSSAWHAYGYKHPSKFRLGWLEGIAYEIAHKLNMAQLEARRAAAREAGDQPINPRLPAVVNRAIELYEQEHFWYIKKTLNFDDTKDSPQLKGSGRGHMAGMRDGDKFDLQSGLDAGRANSRPLLNGGPG